MLRSTTYLTAVIASLMLVACAKTGISSDPVAVVADQPSISQPLAIEVFFPYQKPVDQFTQTSTVSNPSDAVRFQLSHFPRESSPRLQVSINGVTVTTGFSVNADQLIFQPQPAPNAKITVSYDPENPNDVMTTRALIIPGDIDIQSLRVVLNGVLVRLSDLGLALNNDGNYVFDPAMVLFNFDDPYHVYTSKGLDVLILANEVFPAPPPASNP